MAVVQPEHGGRLELELDSKSDDAVVYRAELSTPKSAVRGVIRVDAIAGHVELELEGDTDQWLLDHARAVVRSLWRSHADCGWPRRVTRWRAGPSRE